ncbi:alpha/beta fold hydrolase [Euzebya rosea]|uniref:alpha/beta fold hydrolase n=1 Tax=Euzebya rosea TaxID=2052804 RepID=UPI000D3E2EE2|nr:alpha/beta fold hydrolase [Euzebya rosea]
MMRRALAGVVVLVLAVVGLVIAGRDTPVEEESLVVEVAGPAGDPPVTLDAGLYVAEGVPLPAPAVLLAHGFGSDRSSLDEAARQWARQGYVVLTWSARGFGASGGTIGLNDPDREIADVSVLVDLLADRREVQQDAPGDPLVAVAGGSYGGGAALMAGAAEPRLDAVVAVAAWHDLAQALSPSATAGPGVLKEQWVSLLFTSALLGGVAAPSSAVTPSSDAVPGSLPSPGAALSSGLCGRFDPVVCALHVEAARAGVLAPEDAALLTARSPAGRLEETDTPTLLVHAMDDTLFPLGQSLANAEALAAADVPFALRWVAGEHGGLPGPDSAAGGEMASWLDRWLTPGDDDGAAPVFAWYDAVSGGEVTAADGPADRVMGSATPTPWMLEDGLLVEGGPGDGAGDETPLVMVHPPGGLPAALSSLPGLGTLAGLLPSIDVPGQSVSVETATLDDDLVLVGRPTLALEVTAVERPEPADADSPPPALLAKLYDVTPGGTATLLHSTVTPLRAAVGRLEVPLEPVAHRFVAGNRLRLVLATTDQALATGREPAVVVADRRSLSLTLPVTTPPRTTTIPALVRVLVPVALVVATALIAALLLRRRESHVAAAAARADAPAVVIEGLAKRYADGKVAVDGLDLVVERGQVFGLLGPNGAGKTTTMRMLLGLITPTEGTVEVLGHRMAPGHPVLHRVGVLVEGPGFAPYLSGRRNLETYWRAAGRDPAEADMDRALEVAALGDAIDRPVRTYSHGMTQRLAIAQALLGRPELLVLDEPTDGLDPEQIRGMRQLLARLGREGITVLVSSHLLAEVEQMCTHAAVVQHGRVIVSGPVAELRGASRSIVVRTDDHDRAAAVLTEALDLDRIDVEGDGIVVHLGDDEGITSPDVVAALVAAGIGVESLTPRGRLEDVFLDLTGGAT